MDNFFNKNLQNVSSKVHILYTQTYWTGLYKICIQLESFIYFSRRKTKKLFLKELICSLTTGLLW